MKTVSLFKLSNAQETLPLLTEEALSSYKFIPCGSHDSRRIGFAENIVDGVFVSDVMGFVTFTIKDQVKKPKKYSIDQLVEAKSLKYLSLFGKEPSSKEIKTFQVEAKEELLPTTQPDEPKEYTIAIRKKDGLVFVEANYKKAEDLLCMVRTAIGSLPLELVTTTTPVTDFMDNAVEKGLKDSLTLGSKGKFVGEDMVHSLSKGSLYDDRAKALIKDGFLAEEVQMEYDGVIIFTLKSDMLLDGLKFDKDLFAANAEEEDKAGDFILKLTEVNNLVNDLLGRLEE